jgi:hypothetical protein
MYSPRPLPPSSEPSPAATLFPSFIAHGEAVRVDGSRRAVVTRGRTVRGWRASIVRTHLGRRRPRPPQTLPAEASPLPSFLCASGVVCACLSLSRLCSRVGGGVVLWLESFVLACCCHAFVRAWRRSTTTHQGSFALACRRRAFVCTWAGEYYCVFRVALDQPDEPSPPRLPRQHHLQHRALCSPCV